MAIGRMGKPDQLVRGDGARAFRVHVTSGKEAIRLMFWKKGNKIEFANVGVKHELLIETEVADDIFDLSDFDP